jgi:hypothetical protein
MNENGGTSNQPKSAPPVPGDSPRPVMDVVARRPVAPAEAPAGRAEIAHPADLVAQIEASEAAPELVKPKVSVHDIIAAQTPKVADDAKKPEDEAKAPTPEPSKPTVNDVTPPPTDGPKEPPADEDPSKLIDEPKLSKKDAKAAKKAAKAAQPKPVKQAKHGNGLAGIIVTTVIVMLALAGAAVYAYMQSNK